MSIFRKSLVLVAIPLATQVLFLAMLVLIRAEQRSAQFWAVHANQVIAQAEACHRTVIECQTHMRGFVLTGLPAFAREYQATRALVPTEFARLRELVDDNKEQSARVDRMTAVSARFIAWMDENMHLQKAGRRHELDERIQSPNATRYVRDLRGQLDEFLRVEHGLEDRRATELTRSGQLQDAVLLTGAALAIAGSVALLVAFNRGIGRRLAVMTENTRSLAEGKVLAPQIPGGDELAQLDAMFHRMAETIRQKEQENELFVYSVSHDLRSPLVNLQGFSQELALVHEDLRALVKDSNLPAASKERAARLLDRDAAESIHYIRTAVTRLAGIIDSLLRLSRAGRVEYRWQHVDVAATVRRIVDALHDSLAKSGATVTVGELPPCWGDPTAIDQIFANLLANAVNYLDPSRPGRIEVGCAADAKGDVMGKTTEGMRVYHVRDNGLGIPEAQQAKVFVAFQRLHPEVGPGEGVGLALVRRVVERHAGLVWLESTPGVGTTFFVALPAEPRQNATIPLPAGPPNVTESSTPGAAG